MTLDTFQKKFGLTQRELQTAGLLALGCSRKEISSSLGVSLSAVSRLVGHIREKTETASMMCAVALCAKNITGPL